MNSQTQRAQRLLACLGDASRFRVMAELMADSCCVTELAQRIGLSQSCTTRHLQCLQRAGLVRSTRSGKRVFFRPAADPRVAALLAWALNAESFPAPELSPPEVRPRSSRARTAARRPAAPEAGNGRRTVPDIEDFLL